jgi:hypothetical protein
MCSLTLVLVVFAWPLLTHNGVHCTVDTVMRSSCVSFRSWHDSGPSKHGPWREQGQ